jgi:hypothetical protein
MQWEADGKPSDPKSRTRVVIAFSCLFVVLIVGAYYASDLGALQERLAARESEAALQGITEPGQIDEALKQHPSNKFLQLMATATRAAGDTNAAIEKLSNELEPAAIAKASNLGGASRSDLEALRSDLKTAQANATTFMPRYVAILKAERDKVEKFASSLNAGKDTTRRLLDSIDRRHAEIAAFTSRMLSARADFYRADESYVGFFIASFGSYKVENGQLIFPFQRDVDRYNAAANAMAAAAKRVPELEEERKGLIKVQQERWAQFVSGK